MSDMYRAHQVSVIVLVHESQEEGRDQQVVNSILTEINELALGDVIIISASPATRVGRL